MPESYTGLCPQATCELGEVASTLQFRVRSESGELICKAWGLYLEGAILIYDPVKDELDWIPIERCMNDLSQAEAASAKELSELVLWSWEREMHGATQGRRSEEEDTEGSPTDKTDKGPDG